MSRIKRYAEETLGETWAEELEDRENGRRQDRKD